MNYDTSVVAPLAQHGEKTISSASHETERGQTLLLLFI
jgi:hypothetical protein